MISRFCLPKLHTCSQFVALVLLFMAYLPAAESGSAENDESKCYPLTPCPALAVSEGRALHQPILAGALAPISLEEPTISTGTGSRLAKLRHLMTINDIQAYYVPSEDAHQSEYVSAWDARRKFISGFTGTAGFAIVTHKEAALWTDGRYHFQAEQQLDANWMLIKAGLPDAPTKEAYLARALKEGDRVGVDPQVISWEEAVKFREALETAKLQLVLLEDNLVDAIWVDRPARTLRPIHHLPEEYAGRGLADKLENLWKHLQDNKIWGFLVTALDEVAWLFNLRGSDIECNPNFFSYALITAEGQAFLYVEESMLGQDASDYLKDRVQVRSYRSIFDDLWERRGEIQRSGQKLLVSNSCNAALIERLGSSLVLVGRSPVAMEKAIKNPTELEGFRQCHLRDSVAMIRYFAWLEERLSEGAVLDEVDGAEQLYAFRAEGQHFRGPSFATASASGPNSAIIHYKPERPLAARITLDQMYLCDSGGQYLDGTTDVTRTVHFGTPTDEERDRFTRVLLGNIALERAVFPAGTTGFMLDPLARLPLWAAGLDYRHGTGHGVGHFLNVHEGPHGISCRSYANEVPLKSGMTVTNEPGFYLDGKFGIRIENVLFVRLAETPNRFDNVPFYTFENITMVPLCINLMDTRLLEQRDVDFVNEYHQQCWKLISPLLAADQRALAWLRKETAPISKPTIQGD